MKIVLGNNSEVIGKACDVVDYYRSLVNFNNGKSINDTYILKNQSGIINQITEDVYNYDLDWDDMITVTDETYGYDYHDSNKKEEELYNKNIKDEDIKEVKTITIADNTSCMDLVDSLKEVSAVKTLGVITAGKWVLARGELTKKLTREQENDIISYADDIYLHTDNVDESKIMDELVNRVNSHRNYKKYIKEDMYDEDERLDIIQEVSLM